ncbi:MAG: NAD-dependent epimerase/dehydratase family protein [Chloroflexi bacterium]|nr:NAD-dependent epimerase/dehydratase family protein [Chloroflexota bacterium]
MNVLVVGGTGPTGPFVVNGLIERGHKVTILHTGAHEVEFAEPVEHLHGDPNFKDTIEATLGNRVFDLVIGMYGRTRYVAEVIKGRTPRFIAVGAATYEEGLPLPISETAPLRKEPKLFYLIWTTEQTIMEAHRQGHYSVTYLRYPRVYGPRQMTPAEWPILRRILDGRKQLLLPDGGLIFNSMGYAENVAHAMLLAVDKPKETSGQVYNVRDDQALTLRQRVNMISKAMNYEWELVNIPGELARPSYPYASFGRRDNLSSFLDHRLTDISKIKSELGYRDIVPVEEAIERTVKGLLEHRPKPGGHEETSLGDPFDYAVEDRLIQACEAFSKEVQSIPFGQMKPVHGYAHPKKPGE